MPNLVKTQAQFTNMFREFLQYIRLWRQARALSYRFSSGRIQVYELNDSNSYLSQWSLLGAQRGINCTEDGRLYVKITDETPGANQARIQLYMDAGQTLLVAQGDAANGAVATLAAQNNSGLTGFVTLATITTSPTNIVLLLSIDEMLKNQRAFDISTPGGVAAMQLVTARVKSLGASFQALLGTIRADTEQGYIQTKLREFLFSVDPSVLRVSETLDVNGDATILYEGVLADLKNDMAENTIVQSVLQNTVGSNGISYDADNGGLGVLSVLAVRQNAEPGKLQFTCNAGKTTTLTERFEAVLISGINNDLIRARLPLTIKKIWESRDIGVQAEIDRTITDEADGGNQVGTYVVSGETLQNTDAGNLYLNLDAGAYTGGNNRRVRLYSNAARSQLVAEGFRVGDGTVTLGAVNGSGLSGSCVIAYSGDDHDIIVHLNPFELGDIVTVNVTNDRAGVIQTLFMDIWDIPLPSSGSPTLPDSLIKEGVDHLLSVSP